MRAPSVLGAGGRSAPPIARIRASLHRWHVRQLRYLRRLTLPALGWALLGLGAVVVTHPSRMRLVLSGTIEWWRLAAFVIFSLVLGFGMAALQNWNRARRRR